MIAAIDLISLCLTTVNSQTLALCVLMPALRYLSLKINIVIKERKLGKDHTNLSIAFTLSISFSK
jgi:uncharacterized membrane protein YciS (DUF1049 family)